MQCRKTRYVYGCLRACRIKKPVQYRGMGWMRIKRYIHEKTLVWKIIGIQQYNEERDKYSGG